MIGAKDKIKQYLDFKGISRNKFYIKTGLSMGFLESGVSMGVDKVKIIINSYPDINIEWLVMDQGEMIKIDRALKQENRVGMDVDSSTFQNENRIIDDLITTKNELIDMQRKYIEILETNYAAQNNSKR